MRVFLDANILFSAAKSAGAIRELLSLLSDCGATFCVDAYVAEEARRNLAAKAPAAVAYLEGLLDAAESLPTKAQAEGIETWGLPPKDRPVLAAAILGRCTLLLTGDRTHFGVLYGKRIQGVTVLSPAMMGERVARKVLK